MSCRVRSDEKENLRLHSTCSEVRSYKRGGASVPFFLVTDVIVNGASLICSRAFRPSSSEVNPRRATSFALPLPLPFAPFS